MNTMENEQQTTPQTTATPDTDNSVTTIAHVRKTPKGINIWLPDSAFR